MEKVVADSSSVIACLEGLLPLLGERELGSLLLCLLLLFRRVPKWLGRIDDGAHPDGLPDDQLARGEVDLLGELAQKIQR